MAERYNTPEQGTLDWHLPLNENFDKLNRDVEIRDADANRGNYDPKSGAKFLATDTGTVYIGDGSQWNALGEIVPEQTGGGGGSSGTTDNGTVVATPDDDLQSVLDSASVGDQWGAQAVQHVELVSGAEYETDQTITVPPGTRLDCNGALIQPTGNFDVLHVMHNTEVYEPRISLSGVSWDSVAIKMSPSNAEKINGPVNPARVENAHLFQDRLEGTGFQFMGGNNPVSMVRASGFINKFHKGLEFYASGSDGSGSGDWANGNRFHGAIGKSTIAINCRTEGAAVGGNVVRAQVQPTNTSNWVIRQEDAGSGEKIRSNTWMIFPWDIGNLTNQYQSSGDRRAPFWYIGTGQQEYNAVWDLSGKYSNEYVVNKSTIGRNRNGVFVGTGVNPARGTTDFDHPNTHATSDAGYHPDS